ncbi:hypothetical protein BCR33DRAFT_695210 [Rhizoclosmatium globosum]|uniref:O-acyltransferase n=1 Tax=Rhizoclosmatium globosum TaxID=329046 RepID=A0A1Y2CQX2_9FUNG|nr:hypothetical protein BCR33DRAFT_695210 [Rhizoclosmatium globosum]|eukprot:ORY49357.1 hypothetical protein BCR33DRAFT_695210 [Rhizoclosmatium globosum]
MRGFYVLFWWALAWSAISTAYETFMATGSIFKWSLFMQMSDRGKELVVSDAAMILSCFVVVPLVKLVQYKVIPLKVAWIVNSVWLAVWFVTVVSWAYVADWKWTQSGSFVIHCIAMLMKQASYLMSNVDNFWKVKEIPILKREIELLSAEITSPSVDDPTKAEDTKKALTAIETELAIFEGDLKGRVTGLEFPKNLTLFNFIDYMAIPCLVYEIEYPRTTTFRPFYFLMKVAGTLGTFFLLVFIVQHQIIPVLEISTEINFVTSIMRLIGPFMLCFLLVFFIIFEFICNAFAELTFFADREFYEDWWNSTTFDEYARRWNKPVHEFLLRHVYLENITTNKIPRYYSSLLTFFISSLFHELVMAMTGKRLRPWLFLLQMFQIPLIWMASLPFIKSNRTLGNVIFWGGMFLGPPLLGACYAREHYLRP